MFKVIPDKVLFDNRLKLIDFKIMALVTSYTMSKNLCFPSNSHLMKIFNVKTAKTISNSITKLEEFGYIRRKLLYKENSKEISKRIIAPTSMIIYELEEMELLERENTQPTTNILRDLPQLWEKKED